MSIPEDIREEVRARLWRTADEAQWLGLSLKDKARLYENWTRDPSVGGILSRYMEVGQVRVYIKDTLLKGYARDRQSDWERPYRVLGVSLNEAVEQVYVKPHGRRLADGRVLSWGRADDWKLILMAVHERAFEAIDGDPFGVVLLGSIPRFTDSETRAVVEDASCKLGISKLVWLD